MNLPKTDVKATCKKCGKQAIASEFKMDIDSALMVCPSCFKDSKIPKKQDNLSKSSNKPSNISPNRQDNMFKPTSVLPKKQDNTCILQNKPIFSKKLETVSLDEDDESDLDVTREDNNRKIRPTETAKLLKVPTKTDESDKPGWDRDDIELEKLYAQKQKQRAAFNPLERSGGKLKYRCQKCKYAFPYDERQRTPASCPYCGRRVPDVS